MIDVNVLNSQTVYGKWTMSQSEISIMCLDTGPHGGGVSAAALHQKDHGFNY